MLQLTNDYLTALNNYMDFKQLSQKTKDNYIYFYDLYSEKYNELNIKNIGDFLKENPSSSPKAMIKNLISSLLRWDSITDEEKLRIRLIDIPNITSKKDKKSTNVMDIYDLHKLIDNIHTGDVFFDERIKLMILCQFYGGLRISELLGITYNILMDKNNNFQGQERNLNDKFQSIKISSDSAKFGIERFTNIPTDIFKRMVSWNKLNIIKNYTNKPYDKNNPMWDIKANRYKALFYKYTLQILKKQYNTHSLRHGRGNDLIMNEGKNIEYVKKYLGHADIKSTQRYVHVDDRAIKEDLEK